MIIAKNSMLSEAEILELLKKDSIGVKLNYECVMEYDLEKSHKENYCRVAHDFSKSKEKYFCFCENGQKITINKFCPHCGNGIYKKFSEISTKEYVGQLETATKKRDEEINVYEEKNGIRLYAQWFFNCTQTKTKIYDKFVVYPHPDYAHGIIIKKIEINIDSKKEDIVLSGKVDKYIEIVPGNFSKAYAYKRDGKKEIDLFTAFNLSSHTAKYQIDIDWQNANNMFDFLEKNKEFTKRTAILDVFNRSEFLIYRNNFFMIYMYLYTEYPVFELLAKMNYSKILSDSISKVLKSCNKETMRKNADELEKVFNPHGTTGKLSLNIPKYMGDYLNTVGATYDDFEVWSDIYAYQKISKENFFDIVNNEDFIEIHEVINSYPFLFRYGYTLDKLNAYIKKQQILLSEPKKEIIRLIIDYQKTLELLEAKVDLYPSNIKDVHDKAFAAYRLKKDEMTDIKLKKIKNEALSSVITNDELTIVIPENTTDFIEEGNKQHNCVATYVNQVVRNQCFIFFIRKKETPDISYITAEYRYGKLNQIKEKNNYTVTNPDVKKFAKDFCDKLSKNKYFSSI